jgi:uncharacterized spore protein YtfJ
MDIQGLFSSISERIQTTASVKTVYGDPVEVGEKTIIPVARVRYGFGAGGGTQGGDASAENGEAPGQATGGGGGVEVSPVGFIEINQGETRFVSFEDKRRAIAAAVVGLLLAVFLLRRRRRKM